jgi:hypothetical protein
MSFRVDELASCELTFKMTYFRPGLKCVILDAL